MLFVGCPLTQSIQDNATVQCFGDGLIKGEEDKPSTFFVDTQGRRGELKVDVEGPNSVAKVGSLLFVVDRMKGSIYFLHDSLGIGCFLV